MLNLNLNLIKAPGDVIDYIILHELCYTTLIKDGIAAFNWEEINATVETNFPNYGHALLSTEEFTNLL